MAISTDREPALEIVRGHAGSRSSWDWEDWCARRRRVLAADGVPMDAEVVIDLRDEPAPSSPRPPRLRRLLAPAPPPASPVEAARVVRTSAVTVAALAIVILNLFDVLTTRIALTNGAAEGNPIASLFVDHLWLFLAIKVVVPVGVALRMLKIRERTTPMLLAAMWWVVGVYSLTIVVNVLGILRRTGHL